MLSFELRSDGVSAVADDIGAALGKEDAEQALTAVTQGMETLAASDVLYRRAQSEIDATLDDEGVNAEAPSSKFLSQALIGLTQAASLSSWE